MADKATARAASNITVSISRGPYVDFQVLASVFAATESPHWDLGMRAAGVNGFILASAPLSTRVLSTLCGCMFPICAASPNTSYAQSPVAAPMKARHDCHMPFSPARAGRAPYWDDQF
jgi:hypothetical protein